MAPSEDIFARSRERPHAPEDERVPSFREPIRTLPLPPPPPRRPPPPMNSSARHARYPPLAATLDRPEHQTAGMISGVHEDEGGYAVTGGLLCNGPGRPHNGSAPGTLRANHRSSVERTRALIVGCNYQCSKGLRLWGACADARDWATTMTARMGLPRKNVTLLLDETAEGIPVPEFDENFPSQWNILRHLGALTRDTRPGDLLIFIFCGRGTLLLEGCGIPGDDTEGEDAAVDEEGFVQEGLLCGDFESADMVRGYSMRMVTSRAAAECWEHLPGGASLALILDCAHGASILPVARRLDSSRLTHDASNGQLHPLIFGVSRTYQQVREALRHEMLMGTPSVDPKRGTRDSQGVWPKPFWLRGQLLWGTSGEDDLCALLSPQVQAFAFTASCPGGLAFEAIFANQSATRASSDGSTGGTISGSNASTPICSGRQSPAELPLKRKGGPAGRRGVLTHCLLRALEDMNFHGSYYELWWRAVQCLRSKKMADQHFQLAFSTGADPARRDVFEPLGVSEAEARARHAEQEADLLFEDAFFASHAAECCASSDLDHSVGTPRWMESMRLMSAPPCAFPGDIWTQDAADGECAIQPCVCVVTGDDTDESQNKTELGSVTSTGTSAAASGAPGSCVHNGVKDFRKDGFCTSNGSNQECAVM